MLMQIMEKFVWACRIFTYFLGNFFVR